MSDGPWLRACTGEFGCHDECEACAQRAQCVDVSVTTQVHKLSELSATADAISESVDELDSACQGLGDDDSLVVEIDRVHTHSVDTCRRVQRVAARVRR